jgi:hypothetical protein
MHWPRRTNAQADFQPTLRALVIELMATAVVPGDEVRCNLVIVADPLCLKEIPQPLPRIEPTSVLIVPFGESKESSMIIDNCHEVFGRWPLSLDLGAADECWGKIAAASGLQLPSELLSALRAPGSPQEAACLS